MERMKKVLCLMLLCGCICIPTGIVRAASQPATPSAVKGVYSQDKTRIAIDFAYDANLPYYSPENPTAYGYEVTVMNLKKKVLTVLSTDTSSSSFAFEDSGTVAVLLSGKKYVKQPLLVKIRSFVKDAAGQPLYSEYSEEKVIVPRAVARKLKATSTSSGRITWNKIKGAKKYTVYLSQNDGSSYKKYKSTNKTSMVIQGMKLGKTYRVYIVADGIKYKKKKYKSTKTVDKNAGASTIRIYTSYN